MNKYFFDANLSPKIADALTALGFDATALTRVFPGDTPDEEWLQAVADRVVVTCDRAMQQQDVYRKLLSQKARTVIFLARGWTTLQLPDQASKIIGCWWRVDAAIRNGRAFLLQVNGRLEPLELK